MRKHFEDRKDPVDTVLAALGTVSVPEGLEERVLHGMERRAAARAVEVRWFAAAWWRGAVSGAVVAMLVVGAAILAGRMVHGHANAGQVTGAGAGMPVGRPVAVVEDRGRPCPSTVRVRGDAAPPRRDVVRVATVEWVPAEGEPGLTAEERALVRLVRRGDANQLDTLNPEVRAKVEAEDVAQYQSFFAPPPPPPPQPGEVPAPVPETNE